MLHRQGCALGLLSVGLLFGGNTVERASAVPYASQVRDLGGNMREFVLNENAASITIKRDGANPVVLTAPSAGRHTFDMTGFSSFEIAVDRYGATNWAVISDPANAFSRFERPRGLAVNNIPSSPYFGTVYVANPRTTNTASGRVMGDGIYAMTADIKGVDFANNFGVVADANDATQAKKPGFSVTVPDDGALSTTRDVDAASPWKLSLDAAGNVLVSDNSQFLGGIKWASPDLQHGGLILGTEGGPDGGVLSTVSDEFGPIPLHSGIMSEVTSTGSVGNNLTIWAIDGFLDAQKSSPGNDGNNLWRWNVNNDRSSTRPGEEAFTPHTINPTLVIEAASLGNDTASTAFAAAMGTNGATAANGAHLLGIKGVVSEAFFSPQFNKWYITQNRSEGAESGLIIVDASTPTPTVVWASRQKAAELGLNGNPGTTTPTFNDFMRSAGMAKVSADGTKLYVSRVTTTNATNNPILGAAGTGIPASNLPGVILEIPLDASGLPIIAVDDKGTPMVTSDDRISNWKSISIASNTGSRLPGEFELDAAGNLYSISNISERIEVFSPGGNKRAITRSSGTLFEVQAVTPSGVGGDYDNNGTVGAEDYLVWTAAFGKNAGLPNLSVTKVGNIIDASDFTVWRDALPGAAAVAAVPEPATGLIALLGLVGIGLRTRRKS